MSDAPARVILPMAGASQRFKNAGITLPKSLLPVDGVPMFIKALSSLKAAPFSCDLTVVVRSDFDDHKNVRPVLDEFGYGSANIAAVDRLTRGAVETCYVGLEQCGFSPRQALIVLDVDLYFESTAYWTLLQKTIQTGEGAGTILFHRSTDPRFSFIQTDSNNRVTAIREKQPISDMAVIGSYFFSSCDEFFQTSRALMASSSAGSSELYISGLISKMIEAGSDFTAAQADLYESFGTPEELRLYESISKS